MIKPIPTTAPTAYGASSYTMQSSRVNPMASNYQAPMSVPGSSQLNAFGAPLYSGGNAYNTTNRVANTNVSTGQLVPSNPITGGQNSGVGAQSSAAVNNINNQQSTGLDLIEQDYNNVLGQLAGQEQGLRGQADISGQQISNEAGQVRTQLGQEQATKEQGIQSQLNTAETGAKSQMQEARDLFRQTQQSNVAQLSALGISSSSVAEALAERLGVETSRRIAGVSGSIQEVRQNASQELARTKDYYQQRITDVTNQVEIQKAQIQNSLLSGLNQINSARNQAATDKARGRQQLISNAQNAIYSLLQQQQEFENSLKSWATKKAEALTPIVTDPNFIQTLTQATNTFNQQYAPSGFQYAPQVQTDPYGRIQGNINYSLQKKPIDYTDPTAQ